ncbi:MAG: hypothetical protein VR73_08860 [Gammaproteobacteria bacterium BRH_c0]|nr:MAG: hypothetical protein VR73_08860 [Gammaproteobacteria bacterium BRH_c0]
MKPDTAIAASAKPATRARAKTRSTRGKGRPTQEDSEETLRTLYHVAYAHFIVNGLDGASMQAIAREAGVSRQMIHNRFGNKEQFFNTVVQNGEKIFAGRFSVTSLPDTKDPWVIFNHIGNLIYNILVDPKGIDLFRVMNVALYRHPEIAIFHTQSLNNAYRMISTYLTMSSKALNVEVDKSRAAAQDFVSLIQGLAQPIIQGRMERPGPQTQKREIKGVVNRYLRGVGFKDPEK